LEPEYAKIVRDAVHGYVHLTEKEVEIIDSLVFQRLRGIKQLISSILAQFIPGLNIVWGRLR